MPEFSPTGPEQSSKSAETAEKDFWLDSAVAKKLERQQELGIDPPHVLITVRDGTHSMFGWAFKGTTEELAAYNAETAKLNQYIASRGIILIMNTGGSIEMMEAGLEDGTIPADAALVAGGSELYVVKDGKYVKDEAYQEYIENTIGYKREVLYPICRDLSDDLSSMDPETLPQGFKLEFQPRDSQSNVAAWDRYAQDPRPDNKPVDIEIPQPNKISFYSYGGAEGFEFARAQLQGRLDQLGLGHLRIVHSIDTYDTSRYHMDLLPVGKREAADSVIALMQKQFGPMLAAVAGDAENDIEVILGSGVAGIAVGNRQASLEAAIDEQSATRETKHFKIVDGRLIYKASADRAVGASLLRSIQALERADVLIKNR